MRISSTTQRVTKPWTYRTLREYKERSESQRTIKTIRLVLLRQLLNYWHRPLRVTVFSDPGVMCDDQKSVCTCHLL